MPGEKKEIEPVSSSPARSVQAGEVEYAKAADDEFEVFKTNIDGVQFRLVGWLRASVIFLKSMSILVR